MKYFKLLLIFYNSLIILWFQSGIVEGILGGQDARENQFMYQISLQANRKHVCGGAIIGKQHVITAAHCIIDEKDIFINKRWSIRGGINNIKTINRLEIEVQVEKLYVPKEFKRVNPDPTISIYHDTGDIAILKLQDELVLNENSSLKKLKLPQISLTYSNYNNEKAIITGFGMETMPVNFDRIRKHIDFDTNDYSNKLKFSKATVISKAECIKMHNIPIRDKHLCAQVNQNNLVVQGTCHGDSGGPLVLNDNLLIGILAGGPDNCNEKFRTAIYTRITSFLNFIQLAMNDETTSAFRIAIYRNLKGLGVILGNQMELIEMFDLLSKEHFKRNNEKNENEDS